MVFSFCKITVVSLEFTVPNTKNEENSINVRITSNQKNGSTVQTGKYYSNSKKKTVNLANPHTRKFAVSFLYVLTMNHNQTKEPIKPISLIQ